MSFRAALVRTMLVTVALFGSSCSNRQESVTTRIDKLFTKSFPADAPGAAVIAVHRGEVVFRRAYGSANLELGVPLKPEHVFRLGSVTKQFTAVAILQLIQAGKLKLDDDITSYVPGVQTHGRRVTLEHLLNHTSGLPDITNQAEWRTTVRQDLTLEQQLEFINDKPSLFAPGADWSYCNTGYRLLGAVIEEVTGQSYASYIQERIFKPAGMTHSSYDDARRVTPLRAAGYSADEGGRITNVDFASMVQPHGAGALISNVDDLRKWNEALLAGKVVNRELLQKAYTPARLADGRETSSGFGWQVSYTAGNHAIEHSGGTYGFTTHALSLPEAELFVAVLLNSDRPKLNPMVLCTQIAEIILGPTGALAITVPQTTLENYSGVYRAPHEKIAFAVEGGQFVVKDQSGRTFPLTAISDSQFFAPKIQMRYSFIDDPDYPGRKRVRLKPRSLVERFATWIDEPLMNPLADVPVATLERYAANYQLRPNFVLTVKREGNSLTAQGTGQSMTHLRAESQTLFRVKEVPATIEFKIDESGEVSGLVLRQAGRETHGRRVN